MLFFFLPKNNLVSFSAFEIFKREKKPKANHKKCLFESVPVRVDESGTFPGTLSKPS